MVMRWRFLFAVMLLAMAVARASCVRFRQATEALTARQVRCCHFCEWHVRGLRGVRPAAGMTCFRTSKPHKHNILL